MERNECLQEQTASANDDKRIVNEDGINTTAIGHKDLRK
jgi:hypothetical protein